MVLTIKRLLLIMVLSLFGIVPCSASLYPIGLIQYGNNIDYERLELLETRLVVRLLGYVGYSMNRNYTIRNSGEAYQATLGILFVNTGGWGDPSEMGINFTVDGGQVQYTERVEARRFVMGETIQELESPINTAWALIDVLFPENSTVTIQVQYQTSYSGHSMDSAEVHYNRFFEWGMPANINYWKGSPEFSLQIINESPSIGLMEGIWVGNMQFSHVVNSNISVNMRDYLLGLKNLETNLMRIQRPTGNSVRIYFSEQFINTYRRSFSISVGFWEDGWFPFREWSPEGFVFMHNNITQREFAPYELVFLTNNQLRVLRNAFFARHGFMFRSEDLQSIFSSVRNIIPPNPNFHEGLLTDIDRANIAIIQRLEALAGD